MQEKDDMALLQEYATGGSEKAFAELVARRIGFVYSAALRQVNDAHLAEDITQAVFVLLAQKARKISEKTILAGWLFQTTRYTALAHIRAAAKRQKFERRVQMENEQNATPPDSLWERMSPMLDEALASLGEQDRQAVLLRFFDNRSLSEVGARLGASEDTARKRVSRALEKLHRFFHRRGVSSTTAAIGAVIAAHGVQAAPAALAQSVAAAAVAQGVVAGGSTFFIVKGALNLMASATAKTAAVGVVVAGLATYSAVEYQAKVKLRQENQSLREQVGNLQADNARLSDQAEGAAGPQIFPGEQSRELLRLRGEVGVLRRQTNELSKMLAQMRTPLRAEPQPATALPDGYPKTPDGATRGIFEAFARGDWETFVANFGEPGVPREVYDQIFQDPVKSNYLAGLEIVSLGEPTNSFGPNMWFVPYKIRFRDGTEKEFRLHVAQDTRTQRWFFKGGL